MKHLALFLATWLSAFLLAPGSAFSQTTTPILTLNTEMHTAAIKRISTDSRGRYLLTCSNDKTAKLWELADGELLRTFRLPIDKGNEGKLYGGALSPDSRVAAVGGWTGYDWAAEHSIYIFDATSGLMLHRITGLPNVINDLEFSPDGRYLAAALGGENGIRIFRSSDYALYAQDADYGAESYNLAFDAWGRLATVCYDGHIRLYDSDFKLQKKASSKGGKEPFSLAFSPDTRLLAVGYDDITQIQVLDATTLEVRYEPDITGAGTLGDRLEMVAFSSDGARLAAGYGYKLYKGGNWWWQVRVWEQAGKGSYTDYDGGEDGIMDIKPLPGGLFAYASAQPSWGIINPAARQRSNYIEGEVNAYNASDKSHFRLGPGGLEVGVTPLGGSPLSFSVIGRRFTSLTSYHAAPVTERNGLNVTDWNNNYSPKLNGKPLSILDRYEYVYGLDIATGGQGIVFGTSWNIRCTDAAGSQRWSQSVPGVAWSVNIDEYNEVVAAALSDGTIRWYRFRDGQPLLSLYLHPDNQRWILWTPSGYYDAAPGAENLIGWHVNNGIDREANYYPASKFRQTYYRPDVIDLILETLDEEEALRRANQASNRRSSTTPITAQLPPTVRILSPDNETELSSNTLSLSYSIDSPNNEAVTGIRIQVDGRPVATERGFKPAGKRLEATVIVPSSDCVVSVIAENRFGASEPATIHLRWKGAAPSPAFTDIRPSLYVLAVGVSNYDHGDIEDLSYAAKDATDFTALIQKQEGLLYKSVKTKLLTEAKATKDNILDGLEWLQRETTSRDVAMLFFAGHGIDDNSGNFFYLPSNADPESIRRTCLLHADVQSTVASVAGKILVFMDACHSGSLMREIRRSTMPPDVAVIINELVSAENGAIVFSSATTRQYALEDARWGNGAFTEALLEGLSGRARGPGGKITVKTLDAYVCERVKELTGGQQSPATVYPPNVPDFPVAIVR